MPDRAPAVRDARRTVPIWFGATLLILVVVKATAYWWGSWLAWPDQPMSVLAIYRGQDIEAFPLIRALSRFNVGEAGVLEWIGQGVSSRMAPYIPHAILLAAAGPAGFVVADILVTVVAFLLLARIFERSGIGPTGAFAGAALLVCITVTDFGDPGFRVAGTLVLFWGLRIPRPFVSDLFGWMAILGALVVLRDLRAGRRPGHGALAAVGTGGALLLQSDTFTAGGIGLGLLAGLAALALTGRASMSVLARVAGLVVGWTVLLSLPLLAALGGSRPDIAERLGLFAVDRLHPPIIEDVRLWMAVLLLVLVTVLAGRRRGGPAQARAPSDARALFTLIAVGSLLALPVSAVITGQATQLYHYPLALIPVLWMAVIVMVLQGMQAFLAWWTSRSGGPLTRPGFRRAAALALLAGPCILAINELARVGARRESHMRTDVTAYAAIPDYRTQFVDLTAHLPPSSRTAPLVLATFDHQVWAWWLTFGGGYSYLADACTTTLPDADIELRLVTFARTLGLTRARFLDLMSRRYILGFWHSCARYQATALYTWGEPDDYDAAERRLIERTDPELSFALILPLSERRRLGDLYDSGASSNGRLDLIALTRAGPVADVDAIPGFEQIHENAAFTLWRRQE